MRLLDRYLLRELIVPLFFCLVGFLIFWTAFDLYSDLDEYRLLGIRLYLSRLPNLMTIVLPISLLLALLYTLTNLSRHNEIAAMRSAGISLARLSVPYLMVGIAMGIMQFGITEYFGPRARLLVGATKKNAKGIREESAWREKVRVAKQETGDEQIIGPSRFNTSTHELQEIVAEFNSSTRDRHLFLPQTNEATKISRGEWTSRGWVFYNVHWMWKNPGSYDWPNPKVSRLLDVTNVVGLKIKPEDLMKEVERRSVKTRLTSHDAGKKLLFSVAELLEYGQDGEAATPGTKEYCQVHTQLHGRLAQPFTCIVVVLVALPFGAFLGKREAFVGVAASVALCFAHFMLFELGMWAGTSGMVAGLGALGPLMAAWLPNISFAGIGLGMTWKLR